MFPDVSLPLRPARLPFPGFVLGAALSAVCWAVIGSVVWKLFG